MARWRSRWTLRWMVIITGLIILAYWTLLPKNHKQLDQIDGQLPVERTLSQSTPKAESLQYCDVFNTGSQKKPVCGKAFSAEWLVHLERFGLLDSQIFHLTKEDDERILQKEPTFATAFDDSHSDTAMEHVLKTFHDVFPSKTIIVYDLGLSQETVDQIQKLPWVHSIRQFNFDLYPSYVANLMEYRWKPLLLAELIHEFEAIFYADAHIIYKEGDLDDFLKKPRCQLTGDCYYYSYLTMGNVDHSIYATTDKRLYEYFPFDTAQSKKVEMGDAGFQMGFYTSDVRSYYFKWSVLCALEEGCMAPKGSSIYCNFKGTRWTKYADCHRYDQSVMSILLANRNQYKFNRYFVMFPHWRG